MSEHEQRRALNHLLRMMESAEEILDTATRDDGVYQCLFLAIQDAHLDLSARTVPDPARLHDLATRILSASLDVITNQEG